MMLTYRNFLLGWLAVVPSFIAADDTIVSLPDDHIVSPNGKSVAWANDEGIHVVDVRKQSHRTFTPSGAVNDVVFRRDSTSLALAGKLAGKGSIRLLDIRSGHLREVTTSEHELVSLGYSADGKWLATIDNRGAVTIRDAEQRTIQHFPQAKANGQLALGMTWLGEKKDFAFQKALFPGSYDQWVAWAEREGGARLWKIGDEKPPHYVTGETLKEIRFNSNAEHLEMLDHSGQRGRLPTSEWTSGASEALKTAMRSLPKEELALFRPLQSPDSRVVVEVDQVTEKPRIDGDLSEWENARKLPFAPGLEHFTTAPVFALRDDGAEGDGAAGTTADLSGELSLGWDRAALYLAANVRDNIIDITGAEDSPDAYWWHRDSVSLFLDVPRDGDGGAWKPGDHAFSFIPDPEKPRHYKWWRRGDANGQQETPAPDSVEMRFKINDDGYTLEAAIPMSLLRSQTPDWKPPYDEKLLGFMFIVTDPDGNPADPFGGELIYGGDNDDDGQWAGLRLVKRGVSAPPHFEAPVSASHTDTVDTRILEILEGLQLPEGFEANVFATVPCGPSRMAFAPDGRLFVTAGGWGQGGKAWALTDENGDGTADRREVVIDSLDTPMGLCFRGEDELYLAHNRSSVSLYRPGPPGSPATFVKDVLVTGKSNGHGLGPVIPGADGKLYCAQGSDGDVVTGDSKYDCRVWRMNPDGSEVEFLASGLRFAFGLAFDSKGRLFATEQGPDHKPVDHPDEFNLIAGGQEYGFPYVFTDPQKAKGHVPPIAKFAEHSCACGVAFYNGDKFPDEYKDNAFVALWGPADTYHVNLVSNPRPNWDAYYIARVQTENGKAPVVSKFAGDFRHPADVAVGPDGALYVADWGSTGIGGSQNGAAGDGAIFRIVYKDRPREKESGYSQKVQVISIRSSLDGTKQPALFFNPASDDPTPLLVALHTWSGGWEQTFNVPLAEGCIERGWAFLQPDFRGPNKKPKACGSEFAVADVEDSVAWALRQGNIDPNRVYLAGASGGGHMSLLMAGRAPQLWAAVSSWVPITDCAAWHDECVASGLKYANDLVLSCGGKPGESSRINAEYQRRSPLTWIERAKGLPISINAGIRDGHDGSVPISHSFRAFNLLANEESRLSDDDIQSFTTNAAVPKSLEKERIYTPAYGNKQPLWQRVSGAAEVTIFDGDHEMIPDAVFDFLDSKERRASEHPKETSLSVLTGDQSESLIRYLLSECDRLDTERKIRLQTALSPIGDLKGHLEKLNRSYREILGPFPEKTPLNPVVTGKLDGDGYRLEKVHFESLPQHRVTANLYLPAEGDGPWPGILFACGHSATGKAHHSYQRACAILARNGFVVLSYDPISQGERTQLPKAPRFGTTTHTLLNVGARLVGRSVVWYEAWDGIRSIDYLLSRPEVDSSKPVGMTGTSGGGTQTTFLMALDDRIGPAAPSCYVTERTVKFRSASGIADGCQHIPGEGLHGIDHIDYALMRAPKPTAILAATRDFFDIDSTKRAVKEAEQIYHALGAGKQHHLFVAENDHGMHIEHRQEAVRWMRQWLHNDDRVITEPDFKIFEEEKIRVTKSGQIGSDFKDERSVADLSLERAKTLAPDRASFSKLPLEERRKTVRNLLGLRESPVSTPVTVQRTSSETMDGYRLHRLIFSRDGNVPLAALLAIPSSPSGEATVIVSDQGLGKSLEKIEEQVRTGKIVLALDLRGFGETRDKGSLSKFYNHEHRTANIAMHIGRPLLGQRVEDLMLGVDYLASRPDTNDTISLCASGSTGPVALHACFLDHRIADVSTENSITSWIDDVVAKPLQPNQVGLVVPGVLRFYDLPDLME